MVRFLTPAESQPILTPTNVVLEVDAQDPGGRVVRVDFFFTGSGGPEVALGSLTDPPYRLTLTNFVAFDGAFRAQAVDDRGLVGMYTVRPALRGPEGDEYRRPFLLTGTRVTVEITNDAATEQLGEPLFRDPTIPNSVARTVYHSPWWSWRSPGPGRISISTEDSDFDTVLAVYRGTTFASMIPVAANDDAAPGRMTSLVAFDESLSASTYSIAVDGYARSGWDIDPACPGRIAGRRRDRAVRRLQNVGDLVNSPCRRRDCDTRAERRWDGLLPGYHRPARTLSRSLATERTSSGVRQN